MGFAEGVLGPDVSGYAEDTHSGPALSWEMGNPTLKELTGTGRFGTRHLMENGSERWKDLDPCPALSNVLNCLEPRSPHE